MKERDGVGESKRERKREKRRDKARYQESGGEMKTEREVIDKN
jgi:hypothetical protein